MTTAPSPTTTLDQYHQKPSRSPDELRRQSLQTFPHFEAPTLAPIHSASLELAHAPPLNAYPRKSASPITSTTNITTVAATVIIDKTAEHTRDVVPTGESPKMSDAPAETAVAEPPTQSPPHIKDEPSGTPREQSAPAQATAATDREKSVTDEDLETLRIIEEAKNQFGLRGQKGKRSPTPPSDAATVPAPIEPSKKRPAPKTTAANKKGTAKKPPSKKRRVETDAGHARAVSGTARDTPPSSRTSVSKTPAFGASRGPGAKSKSNTPALGSSPGPGATDIASSEVEDDAPSDASNEEYCICRKGDNHTWMIACDGGCEDWFHGNCVDIREEDGNLIDKYICPNCEENDVGFTTWLPMCRRDGCRQPARVKGVPSKYCSDECGREFMRMNVAKSSGVTGSSNASSKAKNRRKANQTDNHGNSMGVDGTADSDEEMGPRGGALRPGEIKALVTSVPDITLFRKLGEGVLSPPATASPSASKFPDGAMTNGETSNGENSHSHGYTLNSVESSRVAAIDEEKNVLRLKRALLKDKEKFVGMTREQVGKYAEREGIKPKDVCGYDRRLTWTEEQFDRWRQSKEGAAALELNSLDPVENGEADGVTEPAKPKSDADKMDVDGEPAPDTSKDKDHFCTRKRCERHRQWQKQALSDVRFEESTLADQMRRLDKEDREIREGAMLRWRKEIGGQGGEGWVEVVTSS
jgi:COMPASS component SPP1